MKRILVLLVAAVATLAIIGIGGAVAASSSASTTPRADCPYAKDGVPIRARDGSGPGADQKAVKAKVQTTSRAQTKAKVQLRVRNGARQGIRAQDSTEPNARSDVPHSDCDGTGPHGPYRGGN